MPYLYENGTAEAWQKLIEELGPMGYSVQDEESLELHSSLASEVRIILTISLNVQSFPFATEPSISLIILLLMSILQRNLRPTYLIV